MTASQTDGDVKETLQLLHIQTTLVELVAKFPMFVVPLSAIDLGAVVAYVVSYVVLFSNNTYTWQIK